MKDEADVGDEQKEGWFDQRDRLEDSSKQGHGDGTLGGEGGYSGHDIDIVRLDWLVWCNMIFVLALISSSGDLCSLRRHE